MFGDTCSWILRRRLVCRFPTGGRTCTRRRGHCRRGRASARSSWRLGFVVSIAASLSDPTRMRLVLATAFTELVGCQVPIQLAGMPQVSVPRLAAAVADAGGLGMITPTDHTVEVLEQLANETSGKFGINFLIPFLDLEGVEAASSRTRVVDFHFGEPDAVLVARVHQGGALAGWQVGSADEARAA